jgi:hypothetical protein
LLQKTTQLALLLTSKLPQLLGARIALALR